MKKIFLLLILSISTFSYERVVSTVPSLTQTLVSLGLETKIVGVSQFCSFKTQACSKPKVGTSLDLNYEKIFSLKPDLVIVSSTTKNSILKNLKKLKIEVKSFSHDSLSDVLSTIKGMGEVFKVNSRAQHIIENINKEISPLEDHVGKRVILVIGSTIRDGEIVNAYIAGSGSFYNDIFTKMGIVNAYGETTSAYPQLDRERIEGLETDYIIQIFDKESSQKKSQHTVAWNRVLTKMKKTPKYFPLYGEYLFIPGPKIGEIAKSFSKVIGHSND